MHLKSAAITLSFPSTQPGSLPSCACRGLKSGDLKRTVSCWGSEDACTRLTKSTFFTEVKIISWGSTRKKISLSKDFFLCFYLWGQAGKFLCFSFWHVTRNELSWSSSGCLLVGNLKLGRVSAPCPALLMSISQTVLALGSCGKVLHSTPGG